MRYIRSFWFSINYQSPLQFCPAWAEDRATVGTDPSADSGARTEAGCRSRCPFGSRQKNQRTSGLAQSDKSSKNIPLPFEIRETYRGQFTHRFRGGPLFPSRLFPSRDRDCISAWVPWVGFSLPDLRYWSLLSYRIRPCYSFGSVVSQRANRYSTHRKCHDF